MFINTSTSMLQPTDVLKLHLTNIHSLSLLRNFCQDLGHLVEAVSNPPNTPQNLRIAVKLRPEPRR